MCELCSVSPINQQNVNNTYCCDTVSEVLCKNKTIPLWHNDSQRTHCIEIHMKTISANFEVLCGLCGPLCHMVLSYFRRILLLQYHSSTYRLPFADI